MTARPFGYPGDLTPPGQLGLARRVRIVQLTAPSLAALAAGDLATANRSCHLDLTAPFVGPLMSRVWRHRARQVVDEPESASWITGVVVDLYTGRAVGRAGFHGPPDFRGMVEVGYEVIPEHRRRGYARAALQALLIRATWEPAVRHATWRVRPASSRWTSTGTTRTG